MHCPVCDAEMTRQIQSTLSGLVIKDECECGYSTIYYEGTNYDCNKDNRNGTTGDNYTRRSSDI